MKSCNRRTFLKTSAAVTAGTFVLPQFSIGKPGPLANGKLNIAMIGAGNIAEMAYEGCEGENIVALCDVDSDMFDQWAEDFPFIQKAKRFSDFRVMFDNADRSPVLVEEQTLAINFVGVSVLEKPEYAADVQIFPNPTTGWITLDLPEVAIVEKIEIRNVNGQEIGEFSKYDRTFLLPMKGVYLVSIYDNVGKKITKRVVVDF